jgi:hypothetical protein
VTLLLAAVLAFSPWFVTAQTQTPGCWTGWSASIQYRPQTGPAPASPPYIWTGGYLRDGTFLQAGLASGPEDPQGFAWRIQTGKVDGIAWRPIPPTPGAWHAFRAVRSRGIWTISMDGRVLARYANRSCLAVLQAVTEKWADESPGPGTAAFRRLRVRTAAGLWVVPPDFAFGGPGCGADAISLHPGNLVIRPSDRCVGWRQLW